MASTVKSATMAVTVEESIVLNGNQQGSKKTFQIPSVNEVYNRVMTCPKDNETTLAGFADSVDSGSDDLMKIDQQDAKYFRVTNLDDSAVLWVSIEGGVENCIITLQPSQSYVIGTFVDGFNAKDDGTTNFSTTFQSIERIIAKPTTSVDIDVEVLIASA